MMHLQVLRGFPFAWREKWEPHKAADEGAVSKVEVLPRKRCGDSKSPLDKRALTITGRCELLLD